MSSEFPHASPFSRYHRQMLLPGIGEAGQARLSESHALIVGCGALGSALADMLARAGVGVLTLVDRDVVELTNLQRQSLYDERDVRNSTPKAEAARARLSAVNSTITVHAHVDDFNHQNAMRFIDGVDVILDGLDNFETRYLLNDLAVAHGLPYIYGGAVAVGGVSMSVLAHDLRRQGASTSRVQWRNDAATPCLRCVFPEAPPPGTGPTCDTAGVLGPLIMMIAAHQATQALKLLTGHVATLDRSLFSIDVWTNQTRRFNVDGARSDQCPCCGLGRFEYLHGESGQLTAALCGRDSVQIAANGQSTIDLARFAKQLSPHGHFEVNRFMVRGLLNHETSAAGTAIELTLFPNGRAIFKGVRDAQHARTLYSRYIGM